MLYFSEQLPQMRFYNAGNLISRDGFLHERRSMECWVVIYVLAGTLNISSEKRLYSVSAGEWIVLKAGAEHFGTSPSRGELSYLWAHFGAPLCCAEYAPENVALMLPEYAMASAPRVGVLFRQLVDISRRSVYSPAMAQYALGLLLMEMTQESIDNIKDNAGKQNLTRSAPLVEDINEWLRLNCHRRLDIPQIAAHFHYNPEYLSATYKKLSGVTLTRAVNLARIDVAKRLLSNSLISIKEAAFSCGFSDEKYFMRVFRELEGITPSEYRSAIGVK